MARSRETKIELTAYDDLFETDESREEAALSKIREIPIAEIDEFPDHPFKVLMDEDMEQLVDSVRRSGVMTPATVRQKEDGRYELISGHRRKKACELAGLETLKCKVKELTRDEAIIVIYKGEELVDTYTTDENGQFTTKYYICGNDWSVREIAPSEGYLLDTTVHHVGAEPELYTVEYNSAKNDVNEQVIKGNIAITKHTDNGETQIETLEEGLSLKYI